MSRIEFLEKLDEKLDARELSRKCPENLDEGRIMRTVRGTRKGWSALRRKTANKKSAYARRNVLLLGLGYKNYGEYLSSELWSGLRARVIARYSCCVLCGNQSTQVHHLSYDLKTLRGSCLWQLVAVCGPCHAEVEFDGARKRTHEEANAALYWKAGWTHRGRKWLAGLRRQEAKLVRRAQKKKRPPRKK